MNNLHKELYSKAVDACISEANRQGLTHEEGLAWLWEKKYAELIVQECVNQMSDYIECLKSEIEDMQSLIINTKEENEY